MPILDIVSILFLLAGILFSCEIFTNAIENLGERLNLGHAFTGSILAAVGTALPETILPLVAIVIAMQSGAAEAASKEDIAIGAILGAPFMLATLAMFLLGLSIWVHRKTRKSMSLIINIKHLERDLIFFLVTFATALLATTMSSLYMNQIIDFFCAQKFIFQIMLAMGFLHTACIDSWSVLLRIIFAFMMIIFYIIYLVRTYQSSNEELPDEDNDCPVLYLERFFKMKANQGTVILQTIIGLSGIIFFAHGFIEAVEHLAILFAISPMVLSLIVCPIATELPEKINSWIWSSQNKDTLAMGNVSGAMVFQAAIPCAIGVTLTPWALNPLALLCAALALTSGLILLASAKFKKEISYRTLLLCGSLYLVYLLAIAFKWV